MEIDDKIAALYSMIEFQESLRTLVDDKTIEETLKALRIEASGLEELREASSASPLIGKSLPALERKHVTVMFADISGFTALSEKEDPETIRRTIRIVFERLLKIIQRYEGTVEKFIGDAIMVVFGAPVSHENDPERACMSALEMMDAIPEINAELGLELGMHIGLNSGLVIAGSLAVRGQQQYVVTGDTVNLAARLEDKSERGQILAGPSTYRLTCQSFHYEPMGGIRVKGKAEPVEVFLLSAEAGREMAAPAISTVCPMIGREEQYRLLCRRLSALRKRKGSAVLITGETGIGKSRLVAELWQSSEGAGAVKLVGNTHPLCHTMSYWPFIEIFRKIFDITGRDRSEQVFDKLRIGLMKLFPDSHCDMALYLAIMMGASAPEAQRDRIAYTDSESLKGQIFRAVHEYFAYRAEKEPLMMVFEDIHRADSSSVDLLLHISSLVREKPLMIVIVSRPQQGLTDRIISSLENLEPDSSVNVALEPLSEKESLALAEMLLPEGATAHDLCEYISRKGAGNPLFIEEIARHIAAGSAGQRQAALYGKESPPVNVSHTIPDTLHGLVMARVDLLPEEEKSILKTASVIGASFNCTALKALAPGRDIERAIASLERSQFVSAKDGDGQGEYSFKTALVREIVYESVSREIRERLHGLLAQHLESDRSSPPGMLAFHYAEGRQWEKAQQYLFRIGDQAERMAADREALESYEMAIEAYRRAFGDRWDPLMRARLNRRIGEAHFRLGSHHKARAHLFEALETLGHNACGTGKSFAWRFTWDIIEHVGLCIAPGLFRARPEPGGSEALREYFLATQALELIEYEVNPRNCAMLALEHLNSAIRTGRNEEIAISAANIGMTFDVFAMFGMAERYHRKASAAAEDSTNPLARCVTSFSKGLHQSMLCSNEEAIALFRNSAEEAGRAGDFHSWAIAEFEHVCHVTLSGKSDESQSLLKELAEVASQTGDRQVKGWMLTAGGLRSMFYGSASDTEKLMREAIAVLKGIPDYYYAGGALSKLAEWLIVQRREQEALPLLEEGGRFAKRMESKGHLIGWLRNAEALLSLVKLGDALKEKRGKDGESSARRACRKALYDSRISSLSAAPALRLQGIFEWLRGNRAGSLEWWEKSARMAEKTSTMIDCAITWHVWGILADERSSLDTASVLFGECGMSAAPGESGSTFTGALSAFLRSLSSGTAR